MFVHDKRLQSTIRVAGPGAGRTIDEDVGSATDNRSASAAVRTLSEPY